MIRKLFASPFAIMRVYSIVNRFASLLNKKKAGKITVLELLQAGAIEPMLEVLPLLAPEVEVIDDVMDVAETVTSRVSPVVSSVEAAVSSFKASRGVPNLGQIARIATSVEALQMEDGVEDIDDDFFLEAAS